MPGREPKQRSPILLLDSVIVRDKAGDAKTFFVLSTAKHAAQMYEFISDKKDVLSWISNITTSVRSHLTLFDLFFIVLVLVILFPKAMYLHSCFMSAQAQEFKRDYPNFGENLRRDLEESESEEDDEPEAPTTLDAKIRVILG